MLLILRSARLFYLPFDLDGAQFSLHVLCFLALKILPLRALNSVWRAQWEDAPFDCLPVLPAVMLCASVCLVFRFTLPLPPVLPVVIPIAQRLFCSCQVCFLPYRSWNISTLPAIGLLHYRYPPPHTTLYFCYLIH